MSNDIFRKIKENVTATEILNKYVGNPNNAGKWKSPFRQEKTASITAKGNVINDYGCGFTGDGIAFISKLYSVKPIKAAELIANDFGITKDNISSQKIKQIQRQREQQKQQEENIRLEFNYHFEILSDIFHDYKNPELEEFLLMMINSCRDSVKMREVNEIGRRFKQRYQRYA